ncbi:hypothetical protein, partial [Micromonospora sp. NPDC051296]|uniref:hypothetical protein n=1 Tax=Micromonospora sp. NPDC051296 TaxID=3155046 RepID=UPI00341BC292
MREPSADRTYATPDDLPVSAMLPELLRSVREGQVVYLTEQDEPVAGGGSEGGPGGTGMNRRGATV